MKDEKNNESYESEAFMIETPGNKNEYTENGKLYIRKIKSCACLGKRGALYLLRCRIIQRGEREYLYDKAKARISRDNGVEELFLSEDTDSTVFKAVSVFEQSICGINSGIYCEMRFAGSGARIYYHRIHKDKYELITRSTSVGGTNSITYEACCTVGEMINILSRESFLTEKEADLLIYSDKETITENPLYLAAATNGDDVLIRQLKLHYGIATDEECSWLSEWMGCRILPPLSPGCDKTYVVEASGIDSSLLDRSGYRIIHRPYFAMKDSTHFLWQLNPHTKNGIDAAKAGAGFITFNEYLALFDLTDRASCSGPSEYDNRRRETDRQGNKE